MSHFPIRRPHRCQPPSAPRRKLDCGALSNRVATTIGGLALFCLAIGFGAAPLHAEAPTVELEEKMLRITGMLKETPAKLEGQVRLTSDADVELELLASDLRLDGRTEEDPEGTMPRGQVELVGPADLKKGKPTDITIRVEDVTRAGVWKGQLKILATVSDSEDPSADSATVELPIRLDLGEPPKVEPVYDDRTFHLVRCQNPVTCALASLVLDRSAERSQWNLILENSGDLPVKILQAEPLVLGKSSDNRPTAAAISLEAPGDPLAPGLLTEIPLTIDSLELDPDQYTGDFRFQLERSDEPVKIKAEIFVRQGPFPALVVLIFGILIGRLARSMQTTEAKLQNALYPEILALRRAAKKLRDPGTVSQIRQEIDALDAEMDRAKKPKDELMQAAEQLGTKIAVLSKIESLAEIVDEKGSAAQKGQISKQLNGARAQALANQLDDAEKTVEAVQADLAGGDSQMGEQVEAAMTAAAEPETEVEASEDETPPTAPAPQPGGGMFGNLLAGLAGVDNLKPEVRFWLGRPLLWLTLLAALALFGLESLYVSKETFGSGGIFDFLGLFIWGVTSDVARQGLLSLQQAATNKGGEAQGGEEGKGAD